MTQWIVVKAAAAHARNGREQLGKIGLAVDWIDRRGIDDQQRGGLIFVKEARIGGVQTLQVAAIDELLIRNATPTDTFE